ncbi:putative major facilitator superfamily transporter [Aureobasidium pullulans]|uniref:Putative major facilitator superfamily transporter n=1 Tax=Aureobasidium pullulans TaxID=5580 RepID=A0A4S9XG14_AURPU|nr:putative major facilitator superfamily transporter [Aureobasidium pullulans]
MGLFRSRKSAAVEPNMVALEEHHKGGEDLTSKVEAVTDVREASVDKDAPSKTEGDASATTRVAEDESKYPTGPKLWLLVLGLCLTIWVVALDNSIIATAIPKITTEWPDALNDVGWIGSSYLLTTTSLQPSFGKVYTYFDVKWTYLSALVIFEVGSIICAAATSSTMLIVGRAVAGVGAAALFSGGMTIIGFIAPLRKRAIYIASLSSMFGIASVVGPLLGGVFTDHATWRWCFWINLPFGGIGLVAVFFFFTNPERRHTNMTFKEKIRQIDLLGAFLLICAIVCLLLALQWGGTTYPWSNSKVWGCLLGFGLIISIFIALQIKLGDRATLPPRILVKQRTVLSSAAYSTFLAMGMYTHIFYLPFYFQAVKNTSAEGSGIRCIAYLVSNTIASIIVGGTITVIGYYFFFMWFGAAIFTVGAGMLYTLEVHSPASKWIGYQLLSGIGAGAGIQIPFIAVQVVLDEKDMPSGNAIAIFFNSLGGAVSISIAQNIFANTLVKDIIKNVPGLDPAAVISAGATHVREVVSAEQLPGVLSAYSNAVTSAFVVPIATSGIAFFVSLFVEWKSIKGKNIMGGGAA